MEQKMIKVMKIVKERWKIVSARTGGRVGGGVIVNRVVSQASWEMGYLSKAI